MIQVSHCGQEVLERTGCEVKSADGSVTVRLEVGFGKWTSDSVVESFTRSYLSFFRYV